jgi:hypothetical protein
MIVKYSMYVIINCNKQKHNNGKFVVFILLRHTRTLCVTYYLEKLCRYLNSVISTEGCLQGVSDIRVLILTSERTPQFLKHFYEKALQIDLKFGIN